MDEGMPQTPVAAGGADLGWEAVASFPPTCARDVADCRRLIESISDVILLCAKDGTCRYASPALTVLLGFAPADVAGRPVFGLVHADDRALFVGVFTEAARGVARTSFEHRCVRFDGQAVWVETNFQLTPGEPGGACDIVAAIRCTAHRNALEEASVAAREQSRLANEQARRAALAEQVAGLGHWRLDPRTGHITWSAEMYRIYGLDPNQPLDLTALMGMTHPDDQASTNAQFERLYRLGEGHHGTLTRIVSANGQIRYLRGNAIAEFGPDGAIIALVGTIMDVSDHRAAALAVERSEARYKLLAENASDLIIQCDADGRLTYVSPSAAWMTGYEPHALLGRTWCELIHPDDVERALAALQAKKAHRGAADATPNEYRVIHYDGSERWFEGRPTPIRDPKTGSVSGFTSIIRDVTARKAAEEELRKARIEAEAAAAAKSEFLANMSHELRTPLTAVLGFSRLIEEQPELTETTKGYLARVSSGGQALLATVNDILDFSKLEAGQVEIKRRPGSPTRLVNDAIELLALQAADKDIFLDATGLDALPAWVTFDSDRIRQILLNLLGNAVKFTEEGGVRLELSYDDVEQRLSFSVMDTGPGLDQEGLDRLFLRFSQVDASSTRKHGGTGLGLAICKGLVEAMGGVIGVESTVGRGSRFWFSIPAAIAEAAVEIAGNAGSGLAIISGCRVLVVDDNRVNRALVTAVLAPFEAELTEACDGLEAIEAASVAPFDVILMDLRMPGLDGVQATRRIRTENGPNSATPIIAFSADITSETAIGLFDGAVAKPLSAAALIEAIAHVLDPQEAAAYVCA